MRLWGLALVGFVSYCIAAGLTFVTRVLVRDGSVIEWIPLAACIAFAGYAHWRLKWRGFLLGVSIGLLVSLVVVAANALWQRWMAESLRF